MKMPGKSATSAPAASEENKSPRPPTSAAQVAPPPAAQEEPAPAAPTRSASESSTAQETVAGNGSLRALLWLSDTNHSDAMSSLLGRLGYQTEYLDIWEQKVEDIHQGRYDVIVTNRNGASPNGERDLFRLVNRLAPETRRRIFMVLVGDEFKTGNGTQAFTAMADLVGSTARSSRSKTSSESSIDPYHPLPFI
jgi:hypothetical protein